MTRPIRIVLVEDNDVFREALELLFSLRADVEVVGSTADGSRATDLCERLRPDVVLLDYRLPDLDGLKVAETLRTSCPAVAVVMLSASVSGNEWRALEQAGVAAYLSKDEDLETVVATLLRAAGRIPA